MKHGSLFSGIGGFDLAAQWMGWENVFHCEINPFCQTVLKHCWPNAISYTDIKQTDFTPHANTIDILTGGFPCQPYSTAGKRLGKEDDRHLWPEMLRAIREIQPRWILGENVRGLTNWNGGVVFDEVQADLEAEGYETLPFLLPACGVNAPHRRDRIWIVAYSKSTGAGQNIGGVRSFCFGRCEGLQDDTLTPNSCNNGQQRANEPEKVNGGGFQERMDEGYEPDPLHGIGNAANANDKRIQRREASGYVAIEGKECQQLIGRYDQPGNWNQFPTQSPVRFRNDGIPFDLDTATLSYSKWCQESIKAAGNAVVPQLVLEIFKAIEQYSTPTTPKSE